MKKLILLLSIIFASDIQAQWTVLSQIQGGPQVNSISVVNQNVMWVCCDAGTVFRSVNGGVNWTLKNTGLPAVNYQCTSAMDSLNCWVGDVTGNIYRTSDGGTSWTLQLSQSNSFSDGIKMFTMNYGIFYGDPVASGQPFQLRYTTNGGTNWIQSPNSPSGPSEYGVEHAWDWIDTGTVWVGTAKTVSGATSARIFKTTSGFAGGVWTASTLNGTGTSEGLYYQAVAFTDANNGLAGSNNSNIRKTTNGGTTWSVVSNPPGLTSFDCEDFHGFKNGSGLIMLSLKSIATGSSCYKTTDLGLNWTQENLPVLGVANGMNEMDFINQSLGYSCGTTGLIMRYGSPSAVVLNNNEVPHGYELAQNYPNPFNPSTKINFSIPLSSNVSLKLFDATGKEVAALIDEFKEVGNYSFEFNATSNLVSGIYYYRLTSGNFTQTKKLALIK